ncbi:hypothetical protein ACIBEK_09330 [Nocardia fusca]|uniref:hypothetical protein n=1 Tax=Nocardia fusca TaxID=941183 RepID=UPI00379B40CE
MCGADDQCHERLFIATAFIASDATDYFGLPRERTVIMGSQAEVRPCGSHGSSDGTPLSNVLSVRPERRRLCWIG